MVCIRFCQCFTSNYLLSWLVCCITEFDVVVRPKQTKSFKWTVNIEEATLDGLKEYIRKTEKPPALENDGAILKFISDGERFSPQDDQDLRKVLRLFVSKNNFKFTVFI